MIENQRKCLEALCGLTSPDAGLCSAFAPIMCGTELDRPTVRRCVRALARKGLAEYFRGLWTDDGRPAGAGYCITAAGITYLEGEENEKDTDSGGTPAADDDRLRRR